MRRLLSAVREWLQLRARLRDERRFHLDCAAAEFHECGLSPRQANRAARLRFGLRFGRGRHVRIAAQELGCDLRGLANLLRAHRVQASAWLQPAVLLSVIALIFLFSPARREIADGVVVRPYQVDVPGAVLLSMEEQSIWSVRGITPAEFDSLRSMTTLTQVERYRGLSVRGRAVAGVSLDAIVSEARGRAGNSRITAEFMQPHWEVHASPVQTAWVIIGFYGVFLAFRSAFGAGPRFLWRWLLYGMGVAALHATASLAVWAFAVQMWGHARFAFGPMFLVYLGISTIQCRYWWSDLGERCPLCFERMVLPLTEGVAGSILFRPAVTESVCAHGHGVLVESRWSRAFRPEESALESLVDL